MATQKERAIAVKTPLGEDVLVLRGMSGSEELGRLYAYDLSLSSTDNAIQVDDILGQNVTIRLDLDDGKSRYFNGFVSRFAQTGRSQSHATYRATIRPWLWFLTRRADCRIFQEMTVPEIIKKVFQDDGFSEFDEALSGTYDKWTYCVQYRETDFNFVSRLMEQEGIYYYFKHEDGKHTLMLCDSGGAHEPLPGNEEVPYHSPSDKVRDDYIYDWSVTREVVPGIYSLQDFDFEKPSVDLAAQSTIQRKHANAEFEIYDYPGEYLDEKGGGGYTRARIEELQWQHEKISGAGTVRGFHPGGRFKLTDYPRSDQNREYLVVSATHDLQAAEFETGRESGGGPSCICGFTAIESKTPYRAPRVTPKPMIQGPQTAIVVGPSGEEIYTDKYGRVKVQFHWDRLGKKDENSSCWIRVAQVWAGKAWGGIQIPRIGQEVMVEFLEGDPDQPIITGRVYNAEHMPPYGLPDNATQSGLKTRSSKGGSDANFNEIRFEDKQGAEELYIHAEKNHTNITEADRSEDVGHDRKLHVGHDKTETIDNNKTITVKVNHVESIGANEKVDVGANRTHSVGANHAETIGANMSIDVGANLTENVAIAYAENVGAAMALNVGAALAIDVGAAMSTNVGAVHSLSVGASSSKNVGSNDSEDIGGGKKVTIAKDLSETISGGHTEAVAKAYSLKAKTISLDAEDEIVIKTGDATITMKKDGTITLKGKDITVQGSGKINAKADGEMVLKGSKIGAN